MNAAILFVPSSVPFSLLLRKPILRTVFDFPKSQKIGPVLPVVSRHQLTRVTYVFSKAGFG